MRNFMFLIGMIILLGVIVGCSNKMEAFNDNNITFEIADTQLNGETKSNIIKISNETGFDLENLSLKMSYPLGEGNMDNKSTERKTTEFIEEFKIKSGEIQDFSIPFSSKANINTIQFEIELKGNVVSGNKKVPFGISGALSALVASH